jgi:carbonic anhydrase
MIGQVLKHCRQYLFVGVWIIAGTATASAGDEAGKGQGGQIDLLKKGNERFVNGEQVSRDLKADRAGVAGGQEPYAIVLTCADSRVPPELLFDETLGRLFVIRNAGNLLDSIVLGSIEYAAEHLHSKLLVVLGHQSCGAVKATVAGGAVPPNIGSIVQRIAPAVAKVRAEGTKEADIVDASIAENVKMQAGLVTQLSTVLKELHGKQEFVVVGAVYNLESGKVAFLN